MYERNARNNYSSEVNTNKDSCVEPSDLIHAETELDLLALAKLRTILLSAPFYDALSTVPIQNFGNAADKVDRVAQLIFEKVMPNNHADDNGRDQHILVQGNATANEETFRK